MDGTGNMALGYSASDATATYPSSGTPAAWPAIRWTRCRRARASFINGTGSQTGSQRWGDYTSMKVDPVDDCTFWYVNEYVPTTSSVGWRLRIGSFKFPELLAGADLHAGRDTRQPGRLRAGGRHLHRRRGLGQRLQQSGDAERYRQPGGHDRRLLG